MILKTLVNLFKPENLLLNVNEAQLKLEILF